MTISPPDDLTYAAAATFFLAAESPRQRQYEALRAYFVEGLPSREVARRFRYTAGAFRTLCHQLRHDPDWRAAFFRNDRRHDSQTPVRDRVRDLAVAMRKQNMSV
jgi:hypothetical protein